MDVLVINDPAYGGERAGNVLRLAGELARPEGIEVRVFLMGDIGHLRTRRPDRTQGLLRPEPDARLDRPPWRKDLDIYRLSSTGDPEVPHVKLPAK